MVAGFRTVSFGAKLQQEKGKRTPGGATKQRRKEKEARGSFRGIKGDKVNNAMIS